MRLWHFSSSVNSFFKRTCAAIQWGQMSDFGRTFRLLPYFMSAINVKSKKLEHPKNCCYELRHDKTNKITCAPSEDSDQPGHPPSLIRVFVVHMKKSWVLSYPLISQRRLWSDWADAQADLCLRWAHISFCWFCHAAAQMNNVDLP